MSDDLQDLSDDELADWLVAYGNAAILPQSRDALFEAARRLREVAALDWEIARLEDAGNA
jgi:hypothetical protein